MTNLKQKVIKSVDSVFMGATVTNTVMFIYSLFEVTSTTSTPAVAVWCSLLGVLSAACWYQVYKDKMNKSYESTVRSIVDNKK